MASVTICGDFGAPQNKVLNISTVSPCICHEVMGPDAMILVFWMLSLKPTFSLSSFTFIKRHVSSSSFSSLRVVSSVCLRSMIFLPPILIPACGSLSLAFCVLLSAYKLNKQGDYIHGYNTVSIVFLFSDFWLLGMWHLMSTRDWPRNPLPTTLEGGVLSTRLPAKSLGNAFPNILEEHHSNGNRAHQSDTHLWKEIKMKQMTPLPATTWESMMNKQ